MQSVSPELPNPQVGDGRVGWGISPRHTVGSSLLLQLLTGSSNYLRALLS